MPHVDILYNQLQKIQTDPTKIQIAIEYFEKSIENIRKSLPPVEDATHDETAINIRKRRLNNENLNLSAREVCDIITIQIKERFTFKDHLSGAKLFLKENYAVYQKALPLNDIEQFCRAYPMIDKELLKTELNIFYSRPEINSDPRASGCLTTLNLILSLGLEAVFKEITQALQILVTIPMTTAEPERCFSKLNLIKTFLRNTMCEDRLSALGMLSIENCMVKNIPDFNEKVTQKFSADKSRRMDFNFKK
uniref:HAT C-terminal dimerisation domain-containing protein n=1 Tax=Anoplophora glabripennis TaxID=217634 RepID=V5GRQ1_ANOGL